LLFHSPDAPYPFPITSTNSQFAPRTGHHPNPNPKIARNRLGLNEKAHQIAVEEAVKEKAKKEKEAAKAAKAEARKNGRAP